MDPLHEAPEAMSTDAEAKARIGELERQLALRDALLQQVLTQRSEGAAAFVRNHGGH